MWKNTLCIAFMSAMLFFAKLFGILSVEYAHARPVRCSNIPTDMFTTVGGAPITGQRINSGDGRSCSWQSLSGMVNINISPLPSGAGSSKQLVTRAPTQMGLAGCLQASMSDDNQIITVMAYNCVQTTKIVNYLLQLSR